MMNGREDEQPERGQQVEEEDPAHVFERFAEVAVADFFDRGLRVVDRRPAAEDVTKFSALLWIAPPMPTSP